MKTFLLILAIFTIVLKAEKIPPKPEINLDLPNIPKVSEKIIVDQNITPAPKRTVAITGSSVLPDMVINEKKSHFQKVLRL